MVFPKGIIETETKFDNEYCLDTNGRYDRSADSERSPYEPTLYYVLDALVESCHLSSEDRLVDFGSGKGRATIYLSAKTNCKSVGVEFVKELNDIAMVNAKKTKLKHNAIFINILAEDYLIDEQDTCFYFANPFSVSVLKIILSNIKTSLIRCPRKIKLFFHYVSSEYLDFLLKEHWLKHIDTIDCRQFFCQYTGRENILVYEPVSSGEIK